MGLGLSSYSTTNTPENTPGIGSINRANKDWIKKLQLDRAQGNLGLSEAQKDDMVAQTTGQAGAATQSMLAQMPTSGDQAQQQALMRTAASGMQNAVAQAKRNADLASEQKAANQMAELAAQEQALFARRDKNRQFALDAAGAGGEVAGRVIKGIAGCWVAVALWGECERTQMARLHCRRSHGRFYDAYRVHGQDWADWLNAHPWAKPLVAPIWHYLAWRGRMRIADAVHFAKHRSRS